MFDRYSLDPVSTSKTIVPHIPLILGIFVSFLDSTFCIMNCNEHHPIPISPCATYGQSSSYSFLLQILSFIFYQTAQFSYSACSGPVVLAPYVNGLNSEK